MRALVFAAALLSASPVAAQSVSSPDGRIAVTLGTNDQDQPTYALGVGGRPVLAPSVLGLEFERYAKLANGLKVARVDRRAGADRYTLPAGKVSRADERYNEIVVHYVEPSAAGRSLDIVLRAYDTGIALRYRIPRQPG